MTESQCFRHKFLPAYAAIMGCTFPVAVLGAAVDLGFVAHPWKSAALLVFTGVLGAVLTSLWTRMLIAVSPAGLTCYTSAGTYQFVEWTAMTWMRPTRVVLGLPYLRLGCADGRSPLWLPLFLIDMPRFAALVSTNAGPEHPLAVALVTRARAGRHTLRVAPGRGDRATRR